MLSVKKNGENIFAYLKKICIIRRNGQGEVEAMRRLYGFALILLTVTLSGGCFQQLNRDSLYQSSTLGALSEGIYDGETTIGDLKKYGDTGVGTFNALDGEMVAVDGKYYQVKYDGSVVEVDDSTKTPFALIKKFQPDRTLVSDASLNYSRLISYLDANLPTGNIFYAIKIAGNFTYVKTRSVQRQKPPYPRLIDAVKNQSMFEFKNVRGTIIGFRFPDYAAGINMPGYHLHFISEDKKGGGHLLDCEIKNASIQLDYSHDIYLIVPSAGAFYKMNSQKDNKKELEQIEK